MRICSCPDLPEALEIDQLKILQRWKENILRGHLLAVYEIIAGNDSSQSLVTYSLSKETAKWAVQNKQCCHETVRMPK